MRKAIGAGVIALGLIAAGCGQSWDNAHGLGDAPVGKQHEQPRQIWVNIDGMMNVAAFCIGENGVYTHTREAPPVVIRDDPNCDEGGILHE